ncbi:MAG TPA: hypothetical protein VFD36_29565 [Kofleriaceae bacterium]|nr:hypothetical protein [Kofleriaceae bacterium]
MSVPTFTVRIGSVCIEQRSGGNLRIYMSHTPANQMIIENADVDDLSVALDEVLRHRMSPSTTSTPAPPAETREQIAARLHSNEEWLSKNWHLSKHVRRECESNIDRDKAALALLDAAVTPTE